MDSDNELQFYPTPAACVSRAWDAGIFGAARAANAALDPCCGAGDLLRALPVSQRFGLELDPLRAAQASESLGTYVTQCDALGHEWHDGIPVVMNPPFKGRSWYPWFERATLRWSAWMLLPATVLSCRTHVEKLRKCQLVFDPTRYRWNGKTAAPWGVVWVGCGRLERTEGGGEWRVI